MAEGYLVGLTNRFWEEVRAGLAHEFADFVSIPDSELTDLVERAKIYRTTGVYIRGIVASLESKGLLTVSGK